MVLTLIGLFQNLALGGEGWALDKLSLKKNLLKINQWKLVVV